MTSVNNVCLCRHDSCQTFVIRLHRVVFVSALCWSPAEPNRFEKEGNCARAAAGVVVGEGGGCAGTPARVRLGLHPRLLCRQHSAQSCHGPPQPACSHWCVFTLHPHTPKFGPLSKMQLLTVQLWPAFLWFGLHRGKCSHASAPHPLAHCPSLLPKMCLPYSYILTFLVVRQSNTKVCLFTHVYVPGPHLVLHTCM